MKKLVATLIATGMLVGMGTVLGQGLQSHDVEVTLPQLVMIRIVDSAAVDSDGNPTPFAGVGSPTAVVFDLANEYDANTFDPTGTYTPTNLASANWDDVAVFANGTAWYVEIELAGDTFDWDKVSVGTMFDLVDGAEIADGLMTGGWFSLGFGPDDFVLSLDGTEEAGTYSVTVTYTIYSN